MSRLRFTYEEARLRAEELASAFVAKQPWGRDVRMDGAAPAITSKQGGSSKHPTVWHVRFLSYPSDEVWDGNDFLVVVDLEANRAEFQT